MVALRARPPVLLAGRIAPVRPTQQTTGIPQSAASASFEPQTLLSWSAPGTKRTSPPHCFQQVTHSFSRTHNSNHSLFNTFGTLSHKSKMLNHCVSVTCTLFAGSFARVQYSTPFFSIACALFREKWGWRVNSVCIWTVNKLDYRDNDSDMPAHLAKTEGLLTR